MRGWMEVARLMFIGEYSDAQEAWLQPDGHSVYTHLHRSLSYLQMFSGYRMHGPETEYTVR